MVTLLFLFLVNGMVRGFYSDLKKAKKAERIALEVLQMVTDDEYSFIDVSNEEEFYHKGDILFYDREWKCNLYIDVKDDSVIHRSRNINAEHQVNYKDGQGMKDGFMITAAYDYVAYVSKPEKKIYMLDFHKWREHYKKGSFMVMQHPAQYSYCYLMKLERAAELGILLAEITYDGNDESGYYPVEVKKVNW